MRRRHFVQTSVAGLLAGACARRERRPRRPVELTLTIWGGAPEVQAFQDVIDRYERARPDVGVRLEHVPIGATEQIDARLLANQGPDLIRLIYQDIGKYSTAGVLVDLSPYLPPGYGEAFLPAVWQAVQYRGRPYALPHHTDVNALIYNKRLLAKTGARLPQRADDAWSWEEFTDIAARLKTAGAAYGFAPDWTFNGAYRWLTYLHQHGGRLLGDDLRTPAVDSPEGRETMEWTQSWYRRGLVPPGTTPQSKDRIDTLFLTGVIGMVFQSAITFLQDQPDLEWAATYMPRDRRTGTDLGGNAVAVTKDSRHPREAADFLQHLVSEDSMRAFVTSTQFLPVRQRLTNTTLDYPYRPDAMRVYVEQATTLPESLIRTLTVPRFSEINRALARELTLAFAGGRTAVAAVQSLAQRTERILGR